MKDGDVIDVSCAVIFSPCHEYSFKVFKIHQQQSSAEYIKLKLIGLVCSLERNEQDMCSSILKL
jgi:hypothetical protein